MEIFSLPPDGLEKLTHSLEFKFFLSLLVGFLIGLEREIRGKLGQDVFAGIRTFPLIAVLGTLSALIEDRYVNHFLLASYAGILLLSAVNYQVGVQKRSGITTEVAVFLTFTLGVLIYFGYYYETALFAVVITFILATKRVLESFANLLDKEDVFLILQFLVISVLLYPLLPDEELLYGINPKSVWKFVILVSSVSFVGYFLLKIYAAKRETKAIVKSILITALLGGSVSSTAVTLSFARLSKDLPNLTVPLFAGITLAWTVMALRVVLLATLIAPALFWPLLKIFIPFILATLGVVLWTYLRYRGRITEEKALYGNMEIKNPFSWSEIIQFAAVYTAVMALGHYLHQKFGSGGLLLLSITSGIIDVDPITLALAEMFVQNQVQLGAAVVGILLATISNNFFKAFYAFTFGNERLRKLVLSLVAVNVLYGLAATLILTL